MFGWTNPQAGMVLGLHGLKRIGLVLIPARGQRRKQGSPQRAYFLSAIEIPDSVLQDALKQHRQFLGRFVSVLFSQLQHGILHDVQCSLVVANREHRLLERAPLYAGKKVRQFCAGCQMRFLKALGFRLQRPARVWNAASIHAGGEAVPRPVVQFRCSRPFRRMLPKLRRHMQLLRGNT